jgi:hypothetical protein
VAEVAEYLRAEAEFRQTVAVAVAVERVEHSRSKMREYISR